MELRDDEERTAPVNAPIAMSAPEPTDDAPRQLFPIYNVCQTPGGHINIIGSPFLGERVEDRVVVSVNIYIY